MSVSRPDHQKTGLTEADIKRAYLAGYQDGRVYSCAVMAGLQDKKRPDGYWPERRQELCSRTSIADEPA